MLQCGGRLSSNPGGYIEDDGGVSFAIMSERRGCMLDIHAPHNEMTEHEQAADAYLPLVLVAQGYRLVVHKRNRKHPGSVVGKDGKKGPEDKVGNGRVSLSRRHSF